MTNKEAISYFKRSIAIGNTYDERQHNEALDMAIKALEQEPCEDVISRDELLKAIDTWDKFGCDADTKLVPHQGHYISYIHYDDVVKCIKGMPSVTPKPKTGYWIENYAIDGCGELYSHWICSECGRSVGFNYANIEDVLSKYPYCHCGAKMTESEVQ